jgi:hypothetical protein
VHPAAGPRGSATTLNVAYHLADAELRVDVSIEAGDTGDPLARGHLRLADPVAMTDEVSEQSDDGRLWLSFRKAGGRG